MKALKKIFQKFKKGPDLLLFLFYFIFFTVRPYPSSAWAQSPEQLCRRQILRSWLPVQCLPETCIRIFLDRR